MIEVKLVTYNIHRGKDIKNRDTLDEMINYFNESNIDILCLQEVLKSNHDKILQTTNLKGCYQSNVELKNDEYGIGIYYKNEINVHYVEGNLLTSKNEQRGFLNIKLYVNNKLLNVINTHLGLDAQERKVQIMQILKYCETIRGKIFICGDFNEKDVNLKGFYDTAVISNNEYIETFPTSKSRIDYIFMSNNLSICNYYIDFINLSDHYPVNLLFNI